MISAVGKRPQNLLKNAKNMYAATILGNQKMSSPTRYIPWVRDFDLANGNELGGHVTEMCKRIESLDTAEVYGPFTNEELVGEALVVRDERLRVVANRQC